MPRVLLLLRKSVLLFFLRSTANPTSLPLFPLKLSCWDVHLILICSQLSSVGHLESQELKRALFSSPRLTQPPAELSAGLNTAARHTVLEEPLIVQSGAFIRSAHELCAGAFLPSLTVASAFIGWWPHRVTADWVRTIVTKLPQVKQQQRR